ncbi:BspA family leucine-rich repeat surface protein [Peptacetobacter hiranonis]|uniref:BspA family leucine-rich repeat surface protein n=1 Tax=Peptacetobacter hiranonis TaxID=89152 RepID=UPI0022E2C824|nr:BspA family leucine-rich repeat surface protein [Peptacetobacter hiranonis]
MNLNKGIAAVAIAAILLSISNFSSGAESFKYKAKKKSNGTEVVKIASKRHHSHTKFIGSNRYETSSKILESSGNKDTLILVNASKEMSDGLSAAALSGKLKADIVPINPDNVDNATEETIKKAKNIILVGGDSAIPKDFEKRLSGKKITRIGGRDRVETSKEIAKYIGNYKKAYIVNGYTGQADAMSIAPVSARDVSPIILTKPNSESIDSVKNVEYSIIGGKDVVSNSIQESTNSDRIGGKNRYETNRMVLDKFYKDRKSISFCNGETLVDALSGSYFAKDEGIVLVNRTENLNLLENINTTQLGGLPMDIRFVVASSSGVTISEVNTSKDNNKKPIEKKPDKKEETKSSKKDEKDKNLEKDKKVEEDKNASVKTSNTLMIGEDFNSELRMLKGFPRADKIVFNKGIPKDIDKINHVKLDENKSGEVVAYIKDNTVYISSNKTIYANPESDYFMNNFENIKEVDISNLDTSKVVNMKYAFNGCSSLKKINTDKLDTSNVENMSSIFANCTSLESVDLSKLNTKNVTDMSDMFFKCSNLKSIDLSNLDTSNVENMSYMFGDCNGLTEINLNDLNTKKVTNMMSMFANCKNLNEIDLIDLDTDSVTNTSYMFSGCLNLTKLDLSNFNTSNVTNMSYMFASCESLKDVNLENLETKKVENMNGMFYVCRNLKATLNIELEVSSYAGMLDHCAIEDGSKLVLNYTNNSKDTVEKMLKTKSDSANVFLGNLIADSENQQTKKTSENGKAVE